MKDKLKEKAEFSKTVYNLSDLIDLLTDCENKYGNVRVGAVPTIKPSVVIQYHNNGGNPILIIE